MWRECAGGCYEALAPAVLSPVASSNVTDQYGDITQAITSR